MFIRKNKNRSGSTSIQVTKKIGRRNKVIKTIGVSNDPDELEGLIRQAQIYISHQKKLRSIFPSQADQIIKDFINTVSNDDLCVVGPKLVLDKVYDLIGYDKVDPQGYFRHLVTCRIAYPGSKLRTVDYMKRHYKIELSAQTIYRYLDNISEQTKAVVEQITYSYTKKLLGNELGLVFYDMTSLYFETESQDDLRKIGYSKDGKHQHPQVMLGLLVSKGGMPIAYEIFEGNKSETKTLIPLLDMMIERFKIERPVIVADSALLSKSNLLALQENSYQYIVGGRIKNESEQIKTLILKSKIEETKPIQLQHPFGKLIVSYSRKRAAKDLYNRTKGLKRLEAKSKAGKLTKESINNRGYNKYLVLSGTTNVSIDYEKFAADAVWDGLKGYVSNTTLSSTAVIGAYQNLWQVEKAFRMSKTDLRFRPIYHYNLNRIKAHLLVCFTALSVYRGLEYIIKEEGVNISIEKAIKELKEIQQITYKLPSSGEKIDHLLNLNPIQKSLVQLFS